MLAHALKPPQAASPGGRRGAAGGRSVLPRVRRYHGFASFGACRWACWRATRLPRSEFSALSDPRTRWRAIDLVRVSGRRVDSVSACGHQRAPRAPIGNPGFTDRLQHVRLRAVRLGGPAALHQRPGRRRDRLTRWAALGLLTAWSPSTWCCAPRGRSPSSARTTSSDCAHCSTGTAPATRSAYFALRRDKSVVFSTSGKAAVAYRVRLRRDAGQRRPDRRPGGVARRDRQVPGGGRPARLGTGRRRVQ